MLHIPLLRQGAIYKSLDVVRVPHYQTREPFVEISQANSGLIRRGPPSSGSSQGAIVFIFMFPTVANLLQGRGSFYE